MSLEYDDAHDTNLFYDDDHTRHVGMHQDVHVPANVHEYDGFQEKPERLVYVYGNIINHPEGMTLTVLPDGTVENKPDHITADKIADGESRGLIAYTFPQSVSDKAMRDARSSLLAHGHDDRAVDMIAFKRRDGTNALVQSWKVKANDAFFERFVEVEMEHDMQQARDEFEESLKRLFGMHHLPGKIMAVKQKTWNTNSDGLLRGTGANILALMDHHLRYRGGGGYGTIRPTIGDMISSVDVRSNCFETSVYRKGKIVDIKRFYLSPDLEYAVYKNSGWATLLVATPWYQFLFGRKQENGLPFH